MPYPADKLDHVGIPDFAAGAMENLGLHHLPRDGAAGGPGELPGRTRNGWSSTIAHETAHMWFGDLVTMRWWEGIWLNEAFATFMELLVSDAFGPPGRCWIELRGGPRRRIGHRQPARHPAYRVPRRPPRGGRQHVRRPSPTTRAARSCA